MIVGSELEYAQLEQKGAVNGTSAPAATGKRGRMMHATDTDDLVIYNSNGDKRSISLDIEANVQTDITNLTSYVDGEVATLNATVASSIDAHFSEVSVPALYADSGNPYYSSTTATGYSYANVPIATSGLYRIDVNFDNNAVNSSLKLYATDLLDAFKEYGTRQMKMYGTGISTKMVFSYYGHHLNGGLVDYCGNPSYSTFYTSSGATTLPLTFEFYTHTYYNSYQDGGTGVSKIEHGGFRVTAHRIGN